MSLNNIVIRIDDFYKKDKYYAERAIINKNINENV